MRSENVSLTFEATDALLERFPAVMHLFLSLRPSVPESIPVSAFQNMRRRYMLHVTAVIFLLVFVLLWASSFLAEPPKTTVNEDAFEPVHFEMEPVRGKKNIIFIETRCAINSNELEDSGLLLTKRQACAIESAAKMNPDVSVNLLFTCSMNGGMTASPLYVKELFRYPNVKIWKLDIPGFLAGTSLQDWDFKGHLEKSNWPVEHSSDVLRYISLLKYGGTYLDLDVIIRK